PVFPPTYGYLGDASLGRSGSCVGGRRGASPEQRHTVSGNAHVDGICGLPRPPAAPDPPSRARTAPFRGACGRSPPMANTHLWAYFLVLYLKASRKSIFMPICGHLGSGTVASAIGSGGGRRCGRPLAANPLPAGWRESRM